MSPLGHSCQKQILKFILLYEGRTFIFFLTSFSLPFVIYLDKLLGLFSISQMPLQKSSLKGHCFARAKYYWWCVLNGKVIVCSPFKFLYNLFPASVVAFHLCSPLGVSSQTNDLSTGPCVSHICTWPCLLHVGHHLGSHLEVLHLLQLYLKSSGLLPKVGS